MTVIAGLILKDRTILMGGDSAATAETDLRLRRDEKVFLRRPFIYGFTDSFRFGQLLRYGFTPPPVPARGLMRYLVGPYISALRASVKAAGYEDDDGDTASTVLLGIRGRLFTLMDDWQIEETRENYSAVGAGDRLAMGALYATADISERLLRPERRLLLALRAAAAYCSSVRAPFIIRRLEDRR